MFIVPPNSLLHSALFYYNPKNHDSILCLPDCTNEMPREDVQWIPSVLL
jgi:hypothetical protein